MIGSVKLEKYKLQLRIKSLLQRQLEQQEKTNE